MVWIQTTEHRKTTNLSHEMGMEFSKILKKIQKKQRMLLKVIAVRNLEPDSDGRLERIASGLRDFGLIEETSLSLSSTGIELLANFENTIFQDIQLDDDALLDKLLQRIATSSEPKIKKIEKQFLTFLFDVPIAKSNIRGGKNLIPRLQSLGAIVVSGEEVSLTDLGRRLAGTVSATAKEEARSRFFTSVRSDGRSKLADRAERFLALYRNGFTYQEIGDIHGLTRERVRQILNITPNFPAYLQEHEEGERQRELQKEKDSKWKRLEKSLANQFPDRVDELWDREKNLGLDPTQISSRSASVEIWWKCPKDGHSWLKRPCDIVVSWWRSGTSGCPKCAGKTKKPVKQEKLVDVYPQYVRQYWDFEKNEADGLDPNELTLASNWKAWFRCPKDSHSWQGRIHATVRQQWSRGNAGCRVCNGTIDRKLGEWGKAPKLSDEFPEQVRVYWDKEKNDELGLDPSEITLGSSKEGWFRCPVDGHQWSARITAIRQSWSNGSSGCPSCHGRSKGEGFNLTEIYPAFIAEIWDFEENDNDGLSYEKLTTGSGKTATFYCSQHATRWSEPIKEIVRYWELGKNGCPSCTKGRKIKF